MASKAIAATRIWRRARRLWVACFALVGVQCAHLAGLEDHRRASGSTAASGGALGEGGDPATAGGFDRGGAPDGRARGGEPAQGGDESRGGDKGAGGYDSVPSCDEAGPGAANDCGFLNDADCCASRVVEGGSYPCADARVGATNVESFRLDQFEVTVGRFRGFAVAVETEGWRPAQSAGKHPKSANDAAQDAGWDPAWNDRLPSGSAGDDWKGFFDRCDPSAWRVATQADEQEERRPVRCVTWFVATAFCIWDGGYLPSAVELSYAAMGGTQHARYPWGDSPIDPEHAVYSPWSATSTRPVGSLPIGNGRWGQSDLVGNVWEWCRYNAREGGDCEECTCNSFSSTFVNGRSFGGSYEATANEAHALSFQRVPLAQGAYLRDRGIRCARAL